MESSEVNGTGMAVGQGIGRSSSSNGTTAPQRNNNKMTSSSYSTNKKDGDHNRFFGGNPVHCTGNLSSHSSLSSSSSSPWCQSPSPMCFDGGLVVKPQHQSLMTTTNATTAFSLLQDDYQRQRIAFLRPLLSQRKLNNNKSNTGSSPPSSPNSTMTTYNPTEATDKFLSAELKRLTIHEREKATEDIHGISAVIEETPEFVKEKIDSFDEEVMKLRRRHARISTSNFTTAYEKALFLNPQLVSQDVDFKLMFLRGDSFDVEKAANRYMLHFTTKLQLFGWNKFAKQSITLDDLNEEEHEILARGGIQPLPLKDRAGRRVMLVFPKHDICNSMSYVSFYVCFLLCFVCIFLYVFLKP